MLVGYSSSSSEEDGEAGGEAEGAKNQSETTCRKCQEEDDGLPTRKKPKIEEESRKSRCVSWLCNPLSGVSVGDIAKLRKTKPAQTINKYITE